MDRRCGLGHRRLSIIDLSDRASQPMTSEDGRFVVVFNGEIYNYPQLRAELEADGARFRTTSDTEVLLHLYARHGAEMVHRLRGMFAFAIWDEARRAPLPCARSLRHQAALHGKRWLDFPLCLSGQGAARGRTCFARP